MPLIENNSSTPSVDWHAEALDRGKTLTRLCDELWRMMYPGDTNWEYPAQVLRHVQTFVKELKEKAQLSQK